MHMGACPECDADVMFSESPTLNQRIKCGKCNSDLVIIGLTPIELDWAFAEPLVAESYGRSEKHIGGNGKYIR
jgi:hypothetical protein